MKRLLLAIFACLLLAAPGTASARVIEMGQSTDNVKSTCPGDPCQVLNQVTGYQGRGQTRNPYVVPRSGKIVAFTVTLADLAPNQVQFFNGQFGSPASVRLSILRRGKRRKTRLDHRLMAQSEIYRVERYFGSSPTFALDKPLTVHKNYIVALTVPTWAPAFAAYQLPRSNWWRSSRQKGQCKSDPPAKAPQNRVGKVVRYGCTYYTARLQYTATYVPDPRPTPKAGAQVGTVSAAT